MIRRNSLYLIDERCTVQVPLLVEKVGHPACWRIFKETRSSRPAVPWSGNLLEALWFFIIRSTLGVSIDSQRGKQWIIEEKVKRFDDLFRFEVLHRDNQVRAPHKCEQRHQRHNNFYPWTSHSSRVFTDSQCSAVNSRHQSTFTKPDREGNATRTRQYWLARVWPVSKKLALKSTPNKMEPFSSLEHSITNHKPRKSATQQKPHRCEQNFLNALRVWKVGQS